MLNNPSLNDTRLNNLTKDDDWINESTTQNLLLPFNQFLKDVRHEYVEEAEGTFPAEKPMPENPFPDLTKPPAINNPESVRDGPEQMDGPSGGGCSEPVCTEDGICYVECWD